LVLPSWSEGHPNVLIESLACGVPVVATRVGGVVEIVTDENGILVERRNLDSLCAGLRSAFERDWDREAIARATTRTWSTVAHETVAVLEAVVAGDS
jgi:teichuronic acid biosynthesis glycosyltransferase TuaC